MGVCVSGFVIALTVKDLIERFTDSRHHFFFIPLHLRHFSKYLPGTDKVNGLPLAKHLS
jgi:hypothetical protein